jgi:hypothetical protein
MVFDRNTVKIGGSGGYPYKCAWGTTGVETTIVTSEIKSVKDVTITNNVMYSPIQVGMGVHLDTSHASGDLVAGSFLTVAGNTFSLNTGVGGSGSYPVIGIGKQTSSGDTGAVINDVTIKDNVISGTSTNDNAIETKYAPSGFVANGNIYPSNAKFRWNNGTEGDFATWQSDTSQDVDSSVCAPSYKDAAGYDFELAADDTCATAAGVDISGITSVDHDGVTRVARDGGNSGAYEAKGAWLDRPSIDADILVYDSSYPSGYRKQQMSGDCTLAVDGSITCTHATAADSATNSDNAARAGVADWSSAAELAWASISGV